MGKDRDGLVDIREAPYIKRRLLGVFRKYRNEIAYVYKERFSLIGEHEFSLGIAFTLLTIPHLTNRHKYAYCVNANERLMAGKRELVIALDTWLPYMENMEFIVEGETIVVRRFMLYYPGDETNDYMPVPLYDEKLNVKIPLTKDELRLSFETGGIVSLINSMPEYKVTFNV